MRKGKESATWHSGCPVTLRIGNRDSHLTKRSAVALVLIVTSFTAQGQLTDQTQTPNDTSTTIAKSLEQQVGAGRGNESMVGSSLFTIRRDPFRSIRRGRQLFQRKFTLAQGLGPRVGNGSGDIAKIPTIGAGLSDSCSGCHGRPRGAAGFGGTVYTHPDSRDAPHLFGIGLVEQICDEMTSELRKRADTLSDRAKKMGFALTQQLSAKGIDFGTISADRFGTLDYSGVRGVDRDLRVKPFFADGQFFSIRQVILDAFQNEMGMHPVDPDLLAASRGSVVKSPSGMVLNGGLDRLSPPIAQSVNDDPDNDNVTNEIDTALIDHMEFYFLNYFRPATHRRTYLVKYGERVFKNIGCASCHVPDLPLYADRRVADVNTRYQWDESKFNGFNNLFAEVEPRFYEVDDSRSLPSAKYPESGFFMVRGIYSDFKKHDLGKRMHERNFDGTITTHFTTEPLWGVGSTAPYGHDGRSVTLRDIILRHGGEAADSRTHFRRLTPWSEQMLYAFLQSLVLFPPDDTASTLNAGKPGGDPQTEHGSIKLPVLFNDPLDPE